MTEKKWLSIEECERGRLYIVYARNFGLAVCSKGDPRNDKDALSYWRAYGFIGAREKFGHEYPFEEYHHDGGSPYGTVRPVKALEEWIPSDIEPVEHFWNEDSYSENTKLLAWLKAMEEKYAEELELR